MSYKLAHFSQMEEDFVSSGLLFNYKIFLSDHESSKSDCIDKELPIGFIFGGLKVHDSWL